MPVEQPTHAEQVSHRLQPAAAEPVFGLTEASRAMANRDFDNAITGAFYERRHETMHSFEWNERVAALAPHRLAQSVLRFEPKVLPLRYGVSPN